MTYRAPQRRTRSALEADLRTADGSVVSEAIVDAASYDDPAWVQEELLRLLEDERTDVQRSALAGFAILVRRRCLTADRRVWAAVLRASSVPALSGTAEDVLDDFELYGTPGRSQADREASTDE